MAALIALAVVATVPLVLFVLAPLYVHERDRARAHTCTSNLKQIDAAKEAAARALRLADTDTVTEAQIIPYLYRHRMPNCPCGGTYSINAMDRNPTCSLGDRTATGERMAWHRISSGD